DISSPRHRQMSCYFLLSCAIGPFDCAVCSSHPGRYRVPLSSYFQTPPLAAPTNMVIFPDGSRVPAIAEIRPLIVADPILRAPRPEMVADLNGASSAGQSIPQRSSNERDTRTRRTPKALCAKSVKTHVPFRESLRTAHHLPVCVRTSSRRL